MTDATVVIFRKWHNGGILALFPTIPGTNDGQSCQCYEHVGQHGSAGYHCCIASTTVATEAEYAALKLELERIGYTLDVRKRATARMHRERMAAANAR